MHCANFRMSSPRPLAQKPVFAYPPTPLGHAKSLFDGPPLIISMSCNVSDMGITSYQYDEI